jgi:hypothetical protein
MRISLTFITDTEGISRYKNIYCSPREMDVYVQITPGKVDFRFVPDGMAIVIILTKTFCRGDPVAMVSGGSLFIKANEQCQHNIATLRIPLVSETKGTQHRHGNQLLPPSILYHIDAPGVGTAKQEPKDALRHDIHWAIWMYPYSDQNILISISLHAAHS